MEDGASVAIGHWQIALGHGRTAALNMLGQNTPVTSVPFFWTVLFGKSLRYTGMSTDLFAIGLLAVIKKL